MHLAINSDSSSIVVDGHLIVSPLGKYLPNLVEARGILLMTLRSK